MPQPIRKGPFLVCPKSGKPINFNPRCWVWRGLVPLTGFLALAWYLLRVVPKPDRAEYPCQRVAAPLAWGFLGYLLSLSTAVLALRKAGRHLGQARYPLAVACAMIAAVAALQSLQFSPRDVQ